MYTPSWAGRITIGGQHRVFAAAVGLAVMLPVAGCGSHPLSSQAPPSATHTTSVANKAMANARLIAQALVDNTSTGILPLLHEVAGPVMPPYLRMEALWDDVYKAAGASSQAGAVTKAAGGFQMCYAGQGGCQSLSNIRWDSAGRITDFMVDGLPISPRLAVGHTYSGSALTFISVYSYLQTSDGEVNVLFKVRNTSGHVLGSAKQPAFLPVFVTPDGTHLQYKKHYSVIFAGPLAPDAVMEELAVFDTTSPAGKLTLRSDTASRQRLATASLRKVPAPSGF
jgi:hypothetical protein